MAHFLKYFCKSVNLTNSIPSKTLIGYKKLKEVHSCRVKNVYHRFDWEGLSLKLKPNKLLLLNFYYDKYRVATITCKQHWENCTS